MSFCGPLEVCSAEGVGPEVFGLGHSDRVHLREEEEGPQGRPPLPGHCPLLPPTLTCLRWSDYRPFLCFSICLGPWA